MEGILNYKMFLLSSFLIVAIPGQDFFYVTTRGMYLGKKAGLISAAGISAGLMVHTLLAAFGLSIIIQTSAVVYTAIQYCGSAYLIYLGIRTIVSKEEHVEKQNNISTGNIFTQGILTNVFNPKALLVFIAFLPQFIDVGLSKPAGQFVFLGITLSLIAMVWFCLIGYFAGAIGSIMKNNKYVQKVVKILSGSILIVLGVRLSIQEK
jgi:threonine/homoserine/homoserine lactone efflux protein